MKTGRIHTPRNRCHRCTRPLRATQTIWSSERAPQPHCTYQCLMVAHATDGKPDPPALYSGECLRCRDIATGPDAMGGSVICYDCLVEEAFVRMKLDPGALVGLPGKPKLTMPRIGTRDGEVGPQCLDLSRPGFGLLPDRADVREPCPKCDELLGCESIAGGRCLHCGTMLCAERESHGELPRGWSLLDWERRIDPSVPTEEEVTQTGTKRHDSGGEERPARDAFLTWAKRRIEQGGCCKCGDLRRDQVTLDETNVCVSCLRTWLDATDEALKECVDAQVFGAGILREMKAEWEPPQKQPAPMGLQCPECKSLTQHLVDGVCSVCFMERAVEEWGPCGDCGGDPRVRLVAGRCPPCVARYIKGLEGIVFAQRPETDSLSVESDIEEGDGG